MEYLRAQVELEIPVDDDTDMPGKIDEINLKMAILHELGFIEKLSSIIPDNAMPNMAKFLTVICNEDPASWRDILQKLKNLNLENDKDILTELNLNRAHEIMRVFGIDIEKK